MKKTLLITGATRGIGRGLADAAVRAGHTVLGCGRDGQRIEELERQHGAPHHFNVVDVTDDAAVGAWSKGLIARGLVPDLIFNNAALINERVPLWEVPAAEFDTLIDVNVKGVAAIVRHFAPAMIERGSGVFVNLSSGWGRSTSPNVAPYCASKFAIEGLSSALADELPAGLASIALSPGVVHTEMLQVAFGKQEAATAVDPAAWGEAALPYLLGLGPKENGQSLTFAR